MADAAKTETPELTAEEKQTAHVKELLKRFGFKKAAVDKKGNVHFDEAYINKLDAKTLTFIEA